MSEKFDIKEYIQKIAVENGVDSDKALAIAEKCGMDMPIMYQPYGGATSFGEVDASKAGQEYANEVDSLTYALEGIVHNITASPETSADEKAAKIAGAASDYRNKINALKVGQEEKESLWDKAKKLFHKELPPELPANYGFKVYRDLEGDLRWLSLSSNAFEDLDKELFTTKALEEAIEHADKTGERGPLLIYHVPSAEVGQCDYQAMAGRFLVESGTFDDTPLGNKAVEYFTNTDEEHQVSIGFQYHRGDEEDGVYDWARIIERSVTPLGAAANPWTDFKVIGENPMDARKVETLEKIFGKDLTAGIISSAEERTKELEATTRYKDVKTKEPVTISVTGFTLEEMEASAKAAVKEVFEKAKKMTPEEEAAMKKMEEAKKEVDPNSQSDPVPAFGPEQITQLATLITDLSAQVEELTGLSETVKELQTQVKSLSQSDDEKISNIITPKWTLPGTGNRPSESDKNLITDQKVIEALSSEENKPSDPAAAYVEDLLGGRSRVAASN